MKCRHSLFSETFTYSRVHIVFKPTIQPNYNFQIQPNIMYLFVIEHGSMLAKLHHLTNTGTKLPFIRHS